MKNRMLSHVFDLDQVLDVVKQWRALELKIGFTCGAFDLLHAGHVDYLQKAKTLCDRLVVAVNSDRSVGAYKDPLRPINFEHHRTAVVAALECVDAVVLMDDLRPDLLIRRLQPDVYIKGGDYQVERLRSAPLVEAYGGNSVIIPTSHHVSTTQIIKRIETLALHAHPSTAATNAGKPIVFLDRDGTLIENVPFIRSPSLVELRSGVGEGLRLLQDRGFLLVVITNQQGIGLGYLTYQEFVSINSQMLKLLSHYGVRIARFYFCPHSVPDDCGCRKPKTLLVEQALAHFCSRSDRSFFIGDSISDVICAKRSGCNPILLGDGSSCEGAFSAVDFQQAVAHILSCSPFTKTYDEN